MLAEHLDNCNDTVQSQSGLKNSKPRWRGKANQALSTLSAAVQRANSLMPDMWDPIQVDCGASRRDRKAVSALLVFSHHALLLEKTIQVFPSVAMDRA
jgi:hypothetical protein